MRDRRWPSDRELAWMRTPRLKRHWTLLDGEQALGTLHRERMFGTLATAEAGARRWTFKRVGFMRPRVTVRAEDDTVDEAVFHLGWTGGGTLFWPDDRSLRWQQTGLWSSEHAFRDGDETLVRLRPNITGSRARVTIAPGAAARPEMPLLVTLGWYLLQLASEDLAGLGGAAAAGA